MKHVEPLIWLLTFEMTYLNDTSGTFAPQVLKQTHLLAKFRSRLSHKLNDISGTFASQVLKQTPLLAKFRSRLSHKLFSCLFSFSNVHVKDPTIP